MRGHTVGFYATRADLLSVLGQVAKGRRLRFFPAGVFDSEPAPFDSYEEIPSLGQAQTGDTTGEPYFLVVYATDLVTPRSIHLRTGGTRFAIDQTVNPSSVMFCGGGARDAGRVIIAGEVGTISDDPSSVGLWSAFAKPIKKAWKRVKAYYVGPEALVALRRGARLTFSIGSPSTYDLCE